MSFNDLLTVLLTFFILLVSISSVNLGKVQDLSISAAAAFGTVKSARSQSDQSELLHTLGAWNGIEAQTVPGGISVVLPEEMIYRSGSAELIDKELLSRIGAKLRRVDGAIRIEGHTDNVPVSGGPFPSNWELSVQRAVNVVKFLSAECGLAPERLSAAGYADSRPVASNDTPAGRAKNRRVNIIISAK